MDTHRDQYTINPETGRKIKIGTPSWKQLATKYYMIDGKFTDQTNPDTQAYLSNKGLGLTINEKGKKPKHAIQRKRAIDPKGEHKYLIVGSKTWNERYLEYEWNGHEFGDKRRRPLPEFMNTMEKRRQARRNKFFALVDRKVAEGRLSDVIDSTLGYVLTYYHTIDGNMYKEWMNEKRTKKDFRLKNDDDNILWVGLPDGKRRKKWNRLISYSMRVKSSLR